jgi:hypothetical protein
MEREMPDSIRIAVIDDHPLFRQGFMQALTKMDGIAVVGEGATAADALKIAQNLGPDAGESGEGNHAATRVARYSSSHPAVLRRRFAFVARGKILIDSRPIPECGPVERPD